MIQKNNRYDFLCRFFSVSPDFTEEQIKKSYRDLMKKYHPDISTDPQSEEKSKKINQWYKEISNLRKYYTERQHTTIIINGEHTSYDDIAMTVQELMRKIFSGK